METVFHFLQSIVIKVLGKLVTVLAVVETAGKVGTRTRPTTILHRLAPGVDAGAATTDRARMQSPDNTDAALLEGDGVRAARSIGAGTSAGVSKYEAPDDEALWRVSVEAPQVMSEPGGTSANAPEMQSTTAGTVKPEALVKPEAPDVNDNSQVDGLGEDTDDDLETDDDLDDFFLEDDDESDGSYYLSDDLSDVDLTEDERDETVVHTQLEEVQATLVTPATQNAAEAEEEPLCEMTVAEMRAEMLRMQAQADEREKAAYERGRAEERRGRAVERRGTIPLGEDEAIQFGEGEQPRRRKRRRRVEGQSTLDGFLSPETPQHDIRTPDARRQLLEPAVPEAFDIPIPRDASRLFVKWNQVAMSLIPEPVSVYSNFRLAFGDDTDEGVAYRQNEMEAIGKLLFEFKNNRGKPGQHAILKGREREGKTGALFSIALAACMMRMHVVILCAPNKVAPVVDMVKKLRHSGFGQRYYSVRHTLGKKATEDNGIPSAETGEIFVAALCTISDLKRVKGFIDGSKRGGRYTVTLVDECDEITQGKGQKSVDVSAQEDPGAYQRFIPRDERGEDDEDEMYVRPGSRAATTKSLKEQIALASKYFKDNIHPITQIIACSATLSGYIVNPVGAFRNDVVTPIFQVYPKPGYRGINFFEIPPGCELEIEGNLTLKGFKESSAVDTLLRRFYDRKNASDGKELTLRGAVAPGPEPGLSGASGAVTLRGMLFISCSPKVNVYGGVSDIAKTVRNMVTDWGETITHDPKTTLFVCFIGAPKVIFYGKELKVRAGASVEDIYEITEAKTRKGAFEGVFLGANEPLSKVCTHVVVIGYNLMRRATTAAFRPSSEQNVLYKIQYGILTSPKVITIDSVSQRVNRPSHDFGDHDPPTDYKVDVAMSPGTLAMLKVYRAMEDEMVDAQRADPKTHCVFRQKIQVFAHGLEKTRISKRNLPMSELSRTGAKELERQVRDAQYAALDELPELKAFKLWLETTDRRGTAQALAASTVDNYYNRVRQRFFDGDDVDVVEEHAQETIERLQNMRCETGESIDSTSTDELNAMRYFVMWRTNLRVEE